MKAYFTLLMFTSLSYAQDWTVRQLVDDFGDPTGETITAFTAEAKMVNSATTEGYAKVVVRFRSPDDFYFEIFDYNNVPANFMCDIIKVGMKTEAGTVYEEILSKDIVVNSGYVTATNPQNYPYGGDYFKIKAVKAKKLKRMQKEGKTPLYTLLSAYKGELKTYVTCGSTKYNFTLKGVPTPKE